MPSRMPATTASCWAAGCTPATGSRTQRHLAARIADASSHPPVWVFSSGPLGDPPKPDEDPVDVAGIVDLVAPVEHRVFSGKIDKSELGFGERAIMIAVRAPDGDFRDWDEISAWADGIADMLETPQYPG